MAYSSGVDDDEFYCDKCERSFVSEQALQAHLTHSSRHDFYCDNCERRFVSEQALQAHLTHSSRHHYNDDDDFYCATCERSFVSEQALQAHLTQSSRHHVDFYCDQCERSFVSELSLQDHLTYSSHHHYCADCERDFTSNNDLRQHLASKRHQAPFISCPRCKVAFVSASALTKHIEMGICFNKSNQQILHLVRQLEVDCGVPNLLTTPPIAGSQDWDDDDSCDESTVLYATEASYNGSCYVCPICDIGFQRLMSLNQHLNSNTHEPSEFRCRKCCKKFIELSALVGHVESGACGALSALIGHVASKACGTMSAPVGHDGSEACSTMSAPVGHVESEDCNTMRAPVNGHAKSEACGALQVDCGGPNLLTIAGSQDWDDDDSYYESTVLYATEASYNGSCYVCPICERGFQRLMNLNQHLNSNTHEPSEFRCRKCCKKFIELAALVGHVESGECGAPSARIGHVASKACGTMSAPVGHDGSEACSTMRTPVSGHVKSEACGTMSAHQIGNIVRKFGSMCLISCRTITLGVLGLYLFFLFLAPSGTPLLACFFPSLITQAR